MNQEKPTEPELEPITGTDPAELPRGRDMPTPGARTYLDTPMDLATIDVPTFVMEAVNDHLTPWRGAYRTTQLLSGDATFVLSNAGHIASLVNPPGNSKATHLTGPDTGTVDADTWRSRAVQQTGSWWKAWADWTIRHAGAHLAAPARQPGLDDAPGCYVRDQTPS